MGNNGKEPDLWLDKPIGGMKKIEPLPGMRKIAPNIAWGEDYLSWPIEKQLRYAQRLAASMNEAADVLQTERNKLLETVDHQEEQLKEAARRISAQNDLLSNELNRQNKQKQVLNEQIVELSTENRELKKKLKAYEETY